MPVRLVAARRGRRSGLSIRAVGENPEAADAAGISVARVRYVALMLGGALMAVGGAFLTLAVLGQLHARHHRGPRLGVHRARHLRALAHLAGRAGRPDLRGRLLAGAAAADPARASSDVPVEIMLALPYLVVIAALALSGRNVPYPGAYLKPYRRTLSRRRIDEEDAWTTSFLAVAIEQARIGR